MTKRLLGIIAACVLGLAPVAGVQAVETWSPGPDAPTDAPSSFEGSIDSPVNGASLAADRTFHVSGWVVDETAQGWTGVDDLHVYLGLAGAGGTFLARGTLGLDRPDVVESTGNAYWAASGFDATIE